jgi:predicted transcriptional regulator
MLVDVAPAAMIGIEEVAELLHVSPSAARTYLEAQNDPPVAIYHGRELWLSDTVHDLMAERAV